MLFRDRGDAGRRLAADLHFLQGEDVVVLGLPRGGVPVAYEVAQVLGAPLDVIVVRKLGLPYQPELAFGAIGEEGVRIVDERVVQLTGLDEEAIAAVEFGQRAELSRWVGQIRRGHPRVRLTGRTAVIVDDGIASGATARGACRVARARGASRVVLAVPVAARDALDALRHEADHVVCLESAIWFLAVGQWYHDFHQISDEEIADLLHRAAMGFSASQVAAVEHPHAGGEEVHVVADSVELAGRLTIPEHPLGIVVFAHSSGSGRYSPRHRYVASMLNRAGFGTLLLDLLTHDEEIHRANVFDIELLADRLVEVTCWLTRHPDTAGLPVGYFGTSTSAAAALQAAADPRVAITAVVSRGGRPDLTDVDLSAVRAPALLIVGDQDQAALEFNRSAQRALLCENRLAVVPGATHLYAEPGTLERVADLARDWFLTHMAPAAAAAPGTRKRMARP